MEKARKRVPRNRRDAPHEVIRGGAALHGDSLPPAPVCQVQVVQQRCGMAETANCRAIAIQGVLNVIDAAPLASVNGQRQPEAVRRPRGVCEGARGCSVLVGGKVKTNLTNMEHMAVNRRGILCILLSRPPTLKPIGLALIPWGSQDLLTLTSSLNPSKCSRLNPKAPKRTTFSLHRLANATVIVPKSVPRFLDTMGTSPIRILKGVWISENTGPVLGGGGAGRDGEVVAGIFTVLAGE